MSFTIHKNGLVPRQCISTKPSSIIYHGHWESYRFTPLANISRRKEISMSPLATSDDLEIEAAKDRVPENVKKYLEENLKAQSASAKPKVDIDYLAVFGIVVSVASFYLGLSAQITEVANRSNDQREQIKDIAVDVRAFIGKEAAVRSEQLNVLNAKINSLEKKLEKKKGLFF